MKKPELLAPAGTLAMLDTAFAFGADAVYAGQPRYSLRVRNNDFGDLDVLAEGMRRARALGRKFYLVANIFPHGAKLKTFLDDMAPAVALQPDAIIMSDPGLLMLVRETWPDQAIHLSVQANTVNAASVRFWARNGVSRVILSRELSLEEVADIRQACPETELEVFIHGALCIAYSGRCLLSGYFNRRDPNQGTCTNSCRWEYKVGVSGCGASAGDLERGEADVREVLLEEKERPGQFMPIEEDEHGTYILNSKDLRAIEHVRRLVEIGVDSLKIEGRTKSPYYVARTVQAYRRAIDDALAGRGLDPALLASLEGLANRGYTDGFYQRHHDTDYQNYLRGHSESARSLYVGDVVAWDEARGAVAVDVKNRFACGDRVELLNPAGNRNLRVEGMQNEAGAAIDVAPGNGYRVWLPWPRETVGAFVARYLEGPASV
jgi:putative protease